MENPSKKLKLDENSQNDTPEVRDPFKLFDHRFVHIHEEIFSNLTGKDVLNCFLVCKQWNQIVSESPAAMSKIRLRFEEVSTQNPGPREVTELLNSQRRYQNLKFTLKLRSNMKRKLLLLERFSSSLEELELGIKLFGRETQFAVPKDLKMPKLKVFRADNFHISFLYNMVNDIIKQILPTADKLEVYACHSSFEMNQVADILANKAHLKELSIDSGTLSGSSKVLDAKFELNSLVLLDSHSSQSPNPNLVKFCQNQAATITELSLVGSKSRNFGLIWLLPKLAKLDLGYISSYEPYQELLRSHSGPLPNIHELICSQLSDFIRIFIQQSLVNLEVLNVRYLQEDDMEWIQENLPDLDTFDKIYS